VKNHIEMSLLMIIAAILCPKAYSDILTRGATPDIIVDAKLDKIQSGPVLNKVRTLLENFDIGDPLNSTYDKPFDLVESELRCMIPKKGKDLINDLFMYETVQRAMRVKLGAKVERLHYNFTEFHMDVKEFSPQDDKLIVKADFLIGSLSIGADNVQVDLQKCKNASRFEEAEIKSCEEIEREIEEYAQGIHPILSPEEEEIKRYSWCPGGKEDVYSLVKLNIPEVKIVIKSDTSIRIPVEFEVILEEETIRVDILEADFSLVKTHLEKYATPNDGSEAVLLSNGEKAIEIFNQPTQIEGIDGIQSGATQMYSQEAMKDLITQNTPRIKGMLSTIVSDLLDKQDYRGKSYGLKLLELLEGITWDKKYWFEHADMFSHIIVNSLDNLHSKSLEINLPGDFCTKGKKERHEEDCVKRKFKTTKPRLSRLTQENLDESRRVIEREISDPGNDSNIILSVSEDYINKLILTTYDAKLWDDSLRASGIELGDKKAFVVFDKEIRDDGQVRKRAKMYMDIVYKPDGVKSFFLGTKRVHFPLIAEIKSRVESWPIDSDCLIVLKNDRDYVEFYSSITENNAVDDSKWPTCIDDHGEKRDKIQVDLRTVRNNHELNSVPIYLLTIDSVNVDEDLILNGDREYGLPGIATKPERIKGKKREKKENVKFWKKKVYGYIKDELLKTEGKDILSFAYPELRNINMPNSEFKSDGEGRMNVTLKISSKEKSQVEDIARREEEAARRSEFEVQNIVTPDSTPPREEFVTTQTKAENDTEEGEDGMKAVSLETEIEVDPNVLVIDKLPIETEIEKGIPEEETEALSE
jgi:hypothetical protein